MFKCAYGMDSVHIKTHKMHILTNMNCSLQMHINIISSLNVMQYMGITGNTGLCYLDDFEWLEVLLIGQSQSERVCCGC